MSGGGLVGSTSNSQTAHGTQLQLLTQLNQLTQLVAGGLLVASNSQGFISALAIAAVIA